MSISVWDMSIPVRDMSIQLSIDIHKRGFIERLGG